MNLPLIAILIFGFCTSQAPAPSPPQPSLETIVAAHKQLVGQIRRMEVEITFGWQVFKDGKPSAGPQKVAVYYWAKEGSLERIRYQNFVSSTTKEGLPLGGFFDFLNNGTNTKELRNWDPNNPQKINPFRKGTVGGTIAPQSRSSILLDPGRLMLLGFCFDDLDRISFAELIAESRKVQFIGESIVGKEHFWQVRAYRPPTGELDTENDYVDIFLDPQHNFAISKTIESIRSPDGFTYQCKREVQRFKEVDQGIYIPVTISNSMEYNRPDKLTQVQTVDVKVIALNKPLSKDAFDFRFPEHCWVAYDPPVNGKRKVAIWGADDKPKYMLDSLDDLKKVPGWEEYDEPATLIPQRKLSTAWVIALTIIPACVLVIFLILRYRSKKHGS
jgi:hypothetical protein